MNVQNATGPASNPRALVALSEDRQWLVVLTPWLEEGTPWVFDVFENKHGDYLHMQMLKDTGQSAEDVLRDFLSERAG